MFEPGVVLRGLGLVLGSYFLMVVNLGILLVRCCGGLCILGLGL